MSTQKVVIEAPKPESCRPAGDGDSSVQVKILQVSSKRGAAADSSCASPKVIITGQVNQPVSSTGPGPHTSSPSIMVITKVAPPGVVSATGQPRASKPVLSQVTPINQAATPGRTVVITVPRTAAPQSVAVAPRPPPAALSQLPANIQIPPGELHTIAYIHMCQFYR